MKKAILLIVLSSCIVTIYAQYFESHLDENGIVQHSEIPYFNKSAMESDTMVQYGNWPIGFKRNPTFQNFRGLTLEYIDDLPGQEILAAINDSLYVIRGDGTVLWTAKLEGTAIYPPSTADIDNDGEMDIVQVTGGVPYNGHIYAFDAQGNIKTGWPVSVPSCWYICSPVLVDLDNDLDLEIIQGEFNTSQDIAHRNRVHIFNHDGTSFSNNWPINLPHKPAVTPAVADINFDGSKDILICSTDSIYALDLEGNNLPDFPFGQEGVKFSYQSPIIVDYAGSPYYNPLEIYGACHGDSAGFYKLYYNNSIDFNHVCTDGNVWTYSTPTVFGDQTYLDYVLVSQPIGSMPPPLDSCIFDIKEVSDIVHVSSVRYDGLEGFISCASGGSTIFTGSNTHDSNGNGFMHIYNYNNGSLEELDGFPVKVKGSTFMNGINLGDVTGDGYLNMVVLGCSDSTYINVFDVPYEYGYDGYCSWPTYRGTNTRQGVTEPCGYENIESNEQSKLVCYPNPAHDILTIETNNSNSITTYSIIDISGRQIFSQSSDKSNLTINISSLPQGMYFVLSSSVNNKITRTKFVKE
jgi:hypothetical protein